MKKRHKNYSSIALHLKTSPNKTPQGQRDTEAAQEDTSEASFEKIRKDRLLSRPLSKYKSSKKRKDRNKVKTVFCYCASMSQPNRPLAPGEFCILIRLNHIAGQMQIANDTAKHKLCFSVLAKLAFR